MQKLKLKLMLNCSSIATTTSARMSLLRMVRPFMAVVPGVRRVSSVPVASVRVSMPMPFGKMPLPLRASIQATVQTTVQATVQATVQTMQPTVQPLPVMPQALDKEVYVDSVMRKRRKKMKKHKLRKRRRKEKAERRKLSQGR